MNTETIDNPVITRMVEVTLPSKESFLVVMETLTRIGMSSEDAKKLYQTCHILHKAGRYFISHFKLLLELDGIRCNVTDNDIARQNTIANLLESWNLVNIITPIEPGATTSLNLIKVVPAALKGNWELISKHRLGKATKR